MIKAIETVFDGHRFRSRLEARWAVFFREMGIRYEYEPEGFDLDGVWYLPDFWISSIAAFIETKPLVDPDWPPEEHTRLPARFVAATHKKTFVLSGTPGIPEPNSVTTPYIAFPIAPEGPCDSPYFWCECPICGSIGLQFDGRSARNKHLGSCSVQAGEDKNYNTESPRLLAAYLAASTARFDSEVRNAMG